MALALGHKAGLALLDALGISAGNWSRVVVVMDVDDVARVYFKGFLPEQAQAALIEAVRDVTVSDDGDVTVVPHVREG